MLATPAEFSAAVPRSVPSAKKLTVPVGMPPVAEVTFAVRVRGWNCGNEADEKVTAVLVLPVVTVTLSAGAVLFA
jgi:hypothetical protein